MAGSSPAMTPDERRMSQRSSGERPRFGGAFCFPGVRRPSSEQMSGRQVRRTGTATAKGGGIWGMHFIGMLAFSLPCGVSYGPVGTVVSMIPGILASGVALNVISRRTDPGFLQLMLGAVFMGAGIGLMHYSGMAAM